MGFAIPFSLERSLLLFRIDYPSGQYSALLRRLLGQNPSLVGVKYRDRLLSLVLPVFPSHGLQMAPSCGGYRRRGRCFVLSAAITVAVVYGCDFNRWQI